MLLPGGFVAGDSVYFLDKDDKDVKFCEKGVVLGYGEERHPIEVKFADLCWNLPLKSISKTPPPLPGGFVAGEYVYFLDKDDKYVKFCEEGVVLGYGEDTHPIGVKFAEGSWNFCVEAISKTPPPLPGGFVLADSVYFLEKDDEDVKFCEKGVVVGYGKETHPIEVKLAEGTRKFRVTSISKTPPPLPGGFVLGDYVYFLEKDDKVVKFCEEGVVVGYGKKAHPIRVKFAEGTWNFRVSPSSLSKTPPPLPGGFVAGDSVYFLDKDSKNVKFCEKGVVRGYGVEGRPIEVQFAKGSFNIRVHVISKTPPPLTGGTPEKFLEAIRAAEEERRRISLEAYQARRRSSLEAYQAAENTMFFLMRK